MEKAKQEDWAQWLGQLSGEERAALADAIEAHAQRQLATVAACGAALTFAPTLDERLAATERAREELEHFELAAGAYAELGHGDLMQRARSQQTSSPSPSSWPDAAMAQFCLCLAAEVDLAPFSDRPGPMGHTVRRVLAHENEHVRAAVAMLREADISDDAPQLAELFERWLAPALASLRAPGSRESFFERAHALLPQLP